MSESKPTPEDSMPPNPAALTLLPHGHPDLRKVAKAIPDIFDPAFQSLIDRLMACGEAHQGIGIAAPQAGLPVRFFIMASKPNPRYPDAPSMVPTAILHPQVLWRSESSVKGWEGCLSVPGFRGQVPRADALEAAWYDRHGIYHQKRLSGFLARLFQHEFDHLQGILYPDRMQAGDKAITLEEYSAITGIQPPS